MNERLLAFIDSEDSSFRFWDLLKDAMLDEILPGDELTYHTMRLSDVPFATAVDFSVKVWKVPLASLPNMLDMNNGRIINIFPAFY